MDPRRFAGVRSVSVEALIDASKGTRRPTFLAWLRRLLGWR
jgi:hypothetical protein